MLKLIQMENYVKIIAFYSLLSFHSFSHDNDASHLCLEAMCQNTFFSPPISIVFRLHRATFYLQLKFFQLAVRF